MSKARVIFTGSSTDAIYRAEPVELHQGGRGRGGRCCGGGSALEWLPGAGRLLRWAAPLAALLLALAIVLYFITSADMPPGSQRDVRGHPWASEGDDVVALDGDVILDLGDVTYHEGQFHGGGRVKKKQQHDEQQKEQQKEAQTNEDKEEVEAEGRGQGEEDFMEIVPAPDLGTSSSSSAATTSPPHTTSHLLNKLNKATAAAQESSKNQQGTKPTAPAATAPAATTRARLVSATAPSATAPAAVTPSAPLLHRNDSDAGAACFSPRLPLCRGVLPYDLTTLPLVPGVHRLRDLDAAMPYFDMVVESGCSPRARQFVCSLLEPACHPPGTRPLMPCRKACKAVAEDCSDFVLATLDLSRVFQCERYPDLEDSAQCVNFARGDVCLKGEFRCPDGSCVPGRWRCDGVKDCAGGADERNCATCNHDEFRCEGDRKCVPERWRCDSQRDCADGSDEVGCPPSTPPTPTPAPAQGCAPGHFQCADQSACVPERWLCDGLTHCPDGSDERNCSALPCLSGDFRCRQTHQCVPAEWRCNGVNDCADNSDEDHCTAFHAASPLCPVGELRCLDGRCISLRQLCDSHRDCADGADEINCHQLTD